MSQLTTDETLLRRGLKLSHLRLLAALADKGQITLAAEMVGVTQPAASRLLAEIEGIIGHPAHERTGRGIGLTPIGAALARRAQRVQMELRDAARDMAEIAAGGVGHVRIGAVTGPAMDRVLPVVRTARMASPNVTVDVVVQPSDLLCAQLLAGDLDFVLGRLPEGPQRNLLDFSVIAPEPVTLLVRRGHPLLRSTPLTKEALMDYDWVMPGPASILTRSVLKRLREHGLAAPEQRLTTSSFLLTFALLQQSNAIAPLARAVADVFTRGGAAGFVELAIDLDIAVEPYGLITRASMALPPSARRLADQIRAMEPA
jgi:DNA-binding transcriptional LysR family regulator